MITFKQFYNETKLKQCEVFMKDGISNQNDYINLARKMGDLYEDFMMKAQFFRTTVTKILDGLQGAKYVSVETFFKGFFFFFVFKDIVIREIVTYVVEF